MYKILDFAIEKFIPLSGYERIQKIPEILRISRIYLSALDLSSSFPRDSVRNERFRHACNRIKSRAFRTRVTFPTLLISL